MICMTEKTFNQMVISGGNYSVNRKISFRKLGTFKPKTVESVIDFAFNMTFGSKGEHRHTRSGGTLSRGNLEIFINTFQGKLSEFAIANILFKHKDFKEPDLSTHELGVWEDADFMIGDNAIAVKSTKSYGNLILLESKDWNSEGRYIASVGEPRLYSHIVLVRIRPDSEELLRRFRPNPSTEVLRRDLHSILLNLDWEYDIPGFITTLDLLAIVKSDIKIPKGALLNNAVKMDAENFYVQAGDLRDIKDLLPDLSR
jgi:hypothetical protein